MKKIFLITNYFHFKQEKDSNRYRELAELLSNEGYEVEVITSTFYHRTYKDRLNVDELTKDLPFKVTFIKELGYKKNISIQRLRSSKYFAKNLMRYLETQEKPDLIYQVVPSLDQALVSSKFAKKNNIPFVIDVQDLWPEAFKMAINIPIISDLAFLPFKIQANSIYKNADAACAVSETYINRVLKVNHTLKATGVAYIGTNLKEFDKNAREYAHEKDGKIKLAYCGTLSKSYNIPLVMDALSLLDNPPLFVVMGDGHSRTQFEKYAKEKDIDTIFTGFMPYEEMCGMLCSCDITINPIIDSSAASIISKHGDYAACGLPVINTQNSEEYCNLVEEYNMGLNAIDSSAKELADKIKYLTDNPEVRIAMGKNARKCAEEKFDRQQTYSNLIKVIKNLLDK